MWLVVYRSIFGARVLLLAVQRDPPSHASLRYNILLHQPTRAIFSSSAEPLRNGNPNEALQTQSTFLTSPTLLRFVSTSSVAFTATLRLKNDFLSRKGQRLFLILALSFFPRYVN